MDSFPSSSATRTSPSDFFRAFSTASASRDRVGGFEPVDDDLDVLLLVPVEVDLLVGPDDLPVDPDPGVAFLVEVLEELLVRPLLLPDDGGEDRDLARVFGRDLVGDLVRGLGGDGDVVLGAVRASRSGR